MEKNKTGKYFKYAVGEIALVVIGILIALSINNWNESRQEKVALETIYETIKNDLKNDIQEGKSILNHYNPLGGFYVKLIKGTLSEKDYDECNCGKTLIGFKDLYLNKRGFELLKQTNNELIKNSDLPDNILNFYNKNLTYFRLIEGTLNTYMFELTKKWSEKDWWSDFNSGIDETGFRDYLINNKNANNEMSSFRDALVRIYLPRINNFIIDAEVIISEIEKR